MAKMRRKGLKTKQRKRFDINEINAYATAYGRPVGRREYIMYAGIPGLILAGFLTLQFYYPIVSIIGFVVGVWYGLTNTMPNVIRRRYEQSSLDQRNKLIKVVAQIAAGNSKSMLRILGEAILRLDQDGELFDDMIQVLANIGTDISPENINEQFKEKRDKYVQDPTFVQFLEQVQTGIINGNSNAESLQEVEINHSMQLEYRRKYIKEKGIRFDGYKLVCGILVFMMIASSYMLGLSRYIEAYGHNIIGYIFGAVFVGVNLFIFRNYMRDYWDDEITSVGVRR